MHKDVRFIGQKFENSAMAHSTHAKTGRLSIHITEAYCTREGLIHT